MAGVGVSETAEVVGRERELAAVASLVEGALPAALVLEGAPGVGKTTVWRAGTAIAGEAGLSVLSARPVESEADLAFAALGDLFAAPFDRAGGELPRPQRQALAVALLREEPGPHAPDPRAIGVGALGLVRLLAAERPLLVAVDDVQWLDGPSRDALSFALRRLTAEPVAVLLARRPGGGETGLVGDALRPEHVELAPLSLGAVGHLLRRRLSVAFRRPTLQRIHAISGGNPLYALELGRTFLQEGEPEPGAELVLPASLEALVEARLEGLPEPAVEALWVASALAEPLLPLLDRALERSAAEALAPALEAGIVVLDGDRVDFAHPLLRSAALSRRSASERRELHVRLADLVPGAEERGRHLALASDEPDEARAAAVEAAAAAAASRGAAADAATLAERAWRLTPDRGGEPARRRGVLAAESAWVGGDYARGRAIFDELVAAAPPGRARAELLLRVVRQPRDIAETETLCTEGLRDAGGEPALAAELLTFRAMVRYVLGNLEGAAADAAASVDEARATGQERPLAKAEALVQLIRFFSGRSVDRDVLERAAEDDCADGRPERYGPTYWLLLVLGWLDELDDARRWSERYLEHAEHLGHAYRGELLQGLATVEYRAGNLERALECLEEAIGVQADFGVEQMQANTFEGQAAVLVALGRVEEARVALERGRELARTASDASGEVRFHWVSLFLELTRGDAEAAAAHAHEAVALRREGKGPAEDATPVFRDAAEAFVATGQLEDAEALVLELEAAAAEIPRARRVVAAARTRALLEAARGDLDAAAAALKPGLEVLPAFHVPFEAARTLLVAAAVARRQRRRGEARDAAAQALELFEQIGAPLWADKARIELERLGGRAAAGAALTATEERVASLAGEGRSTKEIAAELVVSPKTVEKHLTSIYAKLGVRSRAELAARTQRL